jgi:hypothetical protein
MLLLKYLLLKSTWAWSLSNLAALLRFNLLSYRDLWAWLDAPFEIPTVVAEGEQLTLLEQNVGQHEGGPHWHSNPQPVLIARFYETEVRQLKLFWTAVPLPHFQRGGNQQEVR